MDIKLLRWNPFARFFDKLRPKPEVERDEQATKNSVGYTQEELDSITYHSRLASFDNVIMKEIDFQQLFKSKRERVAKYREMAGSSEISDAIDNITDEAMTITNDKNMASLVIDEKVPRAVQKRAQLAFDYILNDLFKLRKCGWELFEKWLVEGELFIELILNDKMDNIIDFKVLPAFTMFPIYKNNKIIGYTQIVEKNEHGFHLQETERENPTFKPNQIIYISYGKTGKNKLDVRGYLEPAIRPFNQLRSLEDSLIVYRIARAPERKIWNIDVGMMPKGKAEEYIKQMIHRYKKKQVYDPSTGKVDITANMQNMLEDYWFARQNDGKGTTVDTIQGAMNLGELDDVNLFMRKLYKVLKLPRTRWDSDTTYAYSAGRIGEISREEIRFASFVTRLQQKFEKLITQPFMLKLKLMGIDEKWLDENFYTIELAKNNLVAEYKRIELLEIKLGILSTASSYIVTPERVNEADALFAKEYVMKHFYDMPQEDYDLNAELIKKELSTSGASMPGSEDNKTGDNNSPLDRAKAISDNPEESPNEEESKQEVFKQNNGKRKLLEFLEKV